ncbi:hypothetical protein P3G55_20045 [Leptospira sp. 96542]|nr:hypothetical protein [Leptospira sp. 96542]
MLATLLTTSQTLVGYENVSYESLSIIAAYYEYFVPVAEVHFYAGAAVFTSQTIDPINPYQCYDSSINQYKSTIFSSLVGYPFGNQWGRRLIPESSEWTPSGNTGFKTLAEWNALQSEVIGGTKRNLVGSPVYG